MTNPLRESPATTGSAGSGEPFMARLVAFASELSREFGIDPMSIDLKFLAFLRLVGPFGVFSLGPLSIHVQMVEDLVLQRALSTEDGASAESEAEFDEYFVRLAEQRVRTGRARIDELDVLLAFMRMTHGIPATVFGELGVSPERVEAFVAGEGPDTQPLEPLRSPEQAAEYLGVHVETVRSWIRSGRLRATRLAGRRALRIRAADLVGLLEPLDSTED